MVTRLLPVTPARLDCFQTCPRRYRLRYLDRPTPPPGPPFAHTGLGSAVHAALRALADVAPAERTAEVARELLARAWTGAGFRDPDQARHWQRRASDWVGRYLAAGRLGEPVGVERVVAARLGPLALSGRVDRIDAAGEEVVVVDYKCGRTPPAPGEAAASRQLALYAVATAATLGRPCRRVELHHLPTGAVQAHRHLPAGLDRHLERTQALAGDLAAALDTGDFPARPGPLCSWCDQRGHCPMGQAQGPARAPWDGLPAEAAGHQG